MKVRYGRNSIEAGSEEHDKLKARQKEAYIRNAEKRRKYQRERISRKKERNKQYVVNYLSGKRCEECGEGDIQVLTFDHLDPSSKTSTISKMCVSGCSLDRLVKEINKCRILCCNCHMRHTLSQMGGTYHSKLKPISTEEFELKYGDLA